MRQQIAQDERGEAQAGARDFDVPYRVGETLPVVCTVKDVARVFGISESAVHHLTNAVRLPSLSDGFGLLWGFVQREILLVAHGGAHNDTIVTVETLATAAEEAA